MALPNSLRMDPNITPRVRLIACATFVFGVGHLLRLPSLGAETDWLGFLFFASLTAAAEILPIELPKAGLVSVSFATNLACLLIFEPWFGSLASVIGLVVGDISRRRPSLERVLFNVGQISLSAGLASVAYHSTGANITDGLDWLGLWGVGLATSTYFVVNSVLCTLIMSSQDEVGFSRLWARNIKWLIPNYLALAPMGLLIAVIYTRMGINGALLFFVPLLLARYSFQLYVRVNQANKGVIQALAAALEAKDAYTKGHSDRVALYAERVMRKMDLPEELIDTVRYAAEMHDIGKIGISEILLNKPGQLTQDELDRVREHASIGANILRGIGFLKEVSNNIKYHHEWYDGSGGYPKELRGDAIPLGARILMVCDAFDAMTSDRPYRSRIPVEEAAARLREGTGSQFDPLVVDAFIRMLGQEGGLPDAN